MMCTVFVMGTAMQGWLSPGKVFGTALVLLMFFLAIPAGILEEIDKIVGFHITQPTRFSDMDTVAIYLTIYIYNLSFAVVLALLFSILYWTIINVKAGIQISNKGE